MCRLMCDSLYVKGSLEERTLELVYREGPPVAKSRNTTEEKKTLQVLGGEIKEMEDTSNCLLEEKTL